jgi:hypothetical protein
MYLKNFATNLRGGVMRSKSFFLLMICSVYVIMWPTLTSGLDSHHDGLVITTINQTKSALLNGGDAPFNQYGPFWSVTYSLLALPFSSESTLIVSRIITLTIYILTAICLYKTTRRLKTIGLWPLVITLLLLTQPWTAGFGTTFLAWPSALSSLLLSLITYQIVRSEEKTQSSQESAIIGLLICCLIFTRFQIGVAAFLLTVVFLAINWSRKNQLVFFISFMTSSSVVVGLLVSRDWFQDYLFDSVEFSITYVQDKYSVNPTPVFTLSFALIVFILINLFDRRTARLKPRASRRIPSYFYFILGMSTVLMVVAVLVFPNLQNFLIVAVRRFWIGGLLGAIFFAMKKTVFGFGQKSFRDSSHMQLWLLLYGAVGMVQLYPLFDQVHFWWGLAPLVIPLATLILEQIKNLGTDRKNFIFTCLVSIGIITVIVPSLQRAMSEQEIYAAGLVNAVRVSPESNSDQKNLQAFFSRSIVGGSRVLNLCHNSDVYFNVELARSSSRYFIYWPPFIGITKIDSNLKNSDPDTIVTCSQNQVPLASQATNKAHLRIINQLEFEDKFSERILLNGTVWKIYQK